MREPPTARTLKLRLLLSFAAVTVMFALTSLFLVVVLGSVAGIAVVASEV